MRGPQAGTARDGVRRLWRGYRDRSTAPRTACDAIGPQKACAGCHACGGAGSVCDRPVDAQRGDTASRCSTPERRRVCKLPQEPPRSRATPGRTGRQSPCWSARALSIRTTRTRGPRSDGGTTTRGVRRRWRRRVPAIEAALRQALALDPDHIPAAVDLLTLHVDAGRLQDGYDIARRLVARRPDSGEGHFALAAVLRYGGLLEDSARECDEAASRDPDQPGFPDLLGDVHSARAIRSGARLRPPGLRFEWARLVTRWVYQRLGRLQESAASSICRSPGFPSAWWPRVSPALSRNVSRAPSRLARGGWGTMMSGFPSDRGTLNPSIFLPATSRMRRPGGGASAAARVHSAELLRVVSNRDRPRCSPQFATAPSTATLWPRPRHAVLDSANMSEQRRARPEGRHGRRHSGRQRGSYRAHLRSCFGLDVVHEVR